MLRQVKIWFQNRRTKWKKSENVSEAEVAELRSAAGKRSSTCAGAPAHYNSAQDSNTPPQTLPLSQHLFAHGRALQCLASSAGLNSSELLAANIGKWTPRRDALKTHLHAAHVPASQHQLDLTPEVRECRSPEEIPPRQARDEELVEENSGNAL